MIKQPESERIQPLAELKCNCGATRHMRDPAGPEHDARCPLYETEIEAAEPPKSSPDDVTNYEREGEQVEPHCSDAAPEGCELVAHHTGEGWALTVENEDRETVAYLKWPASWPETMSAGQLAAKGFIIL